MAPKLVRVLDTRTVDGRLEGLCEYDDGSQVWREPSSVTVHAQIDRADGSVEHREITDVQVNA